MNWMKRASSILGIFYLVNFGDIAQAELNRSELSNRLASTKMSEHGVIFTRLSDGKVLYEQSADSLLSPASVTKVITSAAALSYFGPAFTFKTPIYYTGKVDKHILKGDLYIKGNGDPFIISEILWQTAVDLRHLGIKEIRGSVIIDNQLFDDEVRDGVCGHPRGHLASVVAAHPVRHDAELAPFIDEEIVLVRGPNPPLLADSVRTQHAVHAPGCVMYRTGGHSPVGIARNGSAPGPLQRCRKAVLSRPPPFL